METQKVLLKTAYCLVGLLILTSIGLNIFQYQLIKKLSENAAPKAVTKEESIDAPMTAPVEMVQESTLKSIGPADKEKDSSMSDINELEYQLEAAEEELDMTSEQLSDELSKKMELKRAASQFQKSMLSDPTYKKMLRDSLKRTLDKNYDPLYKLLELSPEEFDEFKGILVDQMMEAQDMGASILEASFDDEKEEIIERQEEISNRYNNNIREFLGEEKYSTYQNYSNRLSERTYLNNFMESVSPENRINDEKVENLINAMYEARKSVQAEMGPAGEDIRFPSDLTEEKIARQTERLARVHEEYAEVSRDILPPEQVEQFKTFLNRQREMTESSLKMTSQLYGGKTDQNSDEEISD